jgi:hypothetical protein
LTALPSAAPSAASFAFAFACLIAAPSACDASVWHDFSLARDG